MAGGQYDSCREAYFAVYDGHGPFGHVCAQHVQQALPRLVTKHVKRARVKKYQAQLLWQQQQQEQEQAQQQQEQQQQQQDQLQPPPSEASHPHHDHHHHHHKNHPKHRRTALYNPAHWPVLSPDEFKQACHQAYVECNTNLHQDPTIPDDKSGTTAIMVCLHGTLMTVCNVGDSRAVLGHRVPVGNDHATTHPTLRATPIPTKSPRPNGSDHGWSTRPSQEEEEKREVELDDHHHHHDKDSEATAELANRKNGAVSTLLSLSSSSSPPSPSPPSPSPPFASSYPSMILAIPLSRDQTPYRKDERERLKLCGAAIMSMDQMEGLEEMHENWGDPNVLLTNSNNHNELEDMNTSRHTASRLVCDPPRVWMHRKNYPGTSFTRSLGDSIAKQIGVMAEPEMLSRELTSNDQILVVASDGIFECMTNQEVIDLCVTCHSPQHACELLVKTAQERWLWHEKRSDDITIIVCFLQCTRPPPPPGVEGTTEDLIVLAGSTYGFKPVRGQPATLTTTTTITTPPPTLLARKISDGLSVSPSTHCAATESFSVASSVTTLVN